MRINFPAILITCMLTLGIANAVENQGPPEEVTIQNATVWVHVDGTKWRFSLANVQGKPMLAMIMQAQTQQREVVVKGSDQDAAQNPIVSLMRIVD